MISWAIHLLAVGNPIAYFLLFLVVLLTELGVPLPFIMDSILLLTAYKDGLSRHLLYTLLVIITARILGALFLYKLTNLFHRKFLHKFEHRFPSVKAKIDSIVSRLGHHTIFAVAMPRVCGLLYLTSIASGVAKLRYRLFIAGVVLSSFIFDGALVILGLLTRHSFHILGLRPSYWNILLCLILLMAIIWATPFIISRRKFKKSRKKYERFYAKK